MFFIPSDFHNLSHIQITICKSTEFGLVQNFLQEKVKTGAACIIRVSYITTNWLVVYLTPSSTVSQLYRGYIMTKLAYLSLLGLPFPNKNFRLFQTERVSRR